MVAPERDTPGIRRQHLEQADIEAEQRREIVDIGVFSA